MSASIRSLLETFAAKQKAERPKRWDMMEYRYKGTRLCPMTFVSLSKQRHEAAHGRQAFMRCCSCETSRRHMERIVVMIIGFLRCTNRAAPSKQTSRHGISVLLRRRSQRHRRGVSGGVLQPERLRDGV